MKPSAIPVEKPDKVGFFGVPYTGISRVECPEIGHFLTTFIKSVKSGAVYGATYAVRTIVGGARVRVPPHHWVYTTTGSVQHHHWVYTTTHADNGILVFRLGLEA